MPIDGQPERVEWLERRVAELEAELAEAHRRHTRYMVTIDTTLRDIRQRLDTGEPARSDVDEIWALRDGYETMRRTVASCGERVAELEAEVLRLRAALRQIAHYPRRRRRR